MIEVYRKGFQASLCCSYPFSACYVLPRKKVYGGRVLFTQLSPVVDRRLPAKETSLLDPRAGSSKHSGQLRSRAPFWPWASPSSVSRP